MHPRRKWTSVNESDYCSPHTVLSVNEYTPFEKYNFKQYLNEHKKTFPKC